MNSTFLLLIAGLAVFVGAIVQGSVGFGLGLVAAPVVTLLQSEMMPVSIQVVNATLPLFTLASEWRRIDWGGFGWALLGRLPGSVIGALIVAYVSMSTLGVFVGCMVLVAVALSVRLVAVPRSGKTIAGAGFVSGVTGTATGIGGPPIALVFQGAKGPEVRATLAMFFLFSALQSLLLLWGFGEVTAEAVRFGAVLIPFVIAGFLVSGPLRRYLDGGRVRVAILVVAAVSAIALIVQSFFR